MHARHLPSNEPPAPIDLDSVRERLRIPTILAAFLFQQLGMAQVLRPGMLEAYLADGETAVTVRVRPIDLAARAAAARRKALDPIPEPITFVLPT